MVTTAAATRAVDGERSLAVALLLRPERHVAVEPGHVHALTLAEDLVLATEPMQRLRRLRQMGLAHHGLPSAEHTRFAHSVGTAYWAVRMLGGLSSVDRANVERMESLLGPDVSLELVLRLFALIHDIALLPLGHTLRFQIGLFARDGAFGDGLRDCLLRVFDACETRLARTGADNALLTTMRAHLTLCAAVTRARGILGGAAAEPLTDAVAADETIAALPALTFVYDVVHGVYAADLIDICVRDMRAIGRAWELPVGLLSAGAVFVSRPEDASWPTDGTGAHGVDEVFRYGVRAVSDGRVDTTVLTDLAGVHQTRFDIAEKGFYGRTKCAADAMLDKCLRRLQAADPDRLERLLDPSRLLRIGDDEFLDLLIDLERDAGGARRGLAGDIRAGWLHDEVFTLDALIAPNLGEVADGLRTPAQRADLEARIAATVPGLDADEVIVTVLPERMQGKPADTLIGWHDGEVVPFDRLSAQLGFPSAAAELASQYAVLRRLSVFLSRGHPRSADVAAACRTLLAAREVALPFDGGRGGA